MAVHISRSNPLMEALHAAGIIPKETRRVVIDATANEAILIYVEQYGTDVLVNLIPPNVEGATIIMGKPKETQE